VFAKDVICGEVWFGGVGLGEGATALAAVRRGESGTPTLDDQVGDTGVKTHGARGVGDVKLRMASVAGVVVAAVTASIGQALATGWDKGEGKEVRLVWHCVPLLSLRGLDVCPVWRSVTNAGEVHLATL
jgi:hypothetical protein